MAIATLAAYALSRMDFRGRHHFVGWVLSTRMMPPVAIAIPMFFIYKDFGLLDSYTGVGLIHALMNLPLAVLLMKSFFAKAPASLEEYYIQAAPSPRRWGRRCTAPPAR